MIILYPGYSFEMLASDRNETEASQLQAAWTAAFHPALLEHCGVVPHWESASTPPYTVSSEPIIIPPCCETALDENWFRIQEEGGALLIRGLHDRQSIASRLLEKLNLQHHGFDENLLADFFALGTAYFLVDLLVQQLHYMSMLNDSQVSNHLFSALRAFRSNEHESGQDYLKQAFAAVCQSKEYFFPIQSYFLDLTLTSPETLGEPLRQLILARKQVNLFLPAAQLKSLRVKDQDTWVTLRSACEAGKVQLIADDDHGEEIENEPLLLLPILDMTDRILAGLSVYREELNLTPRCFGKMRTGFNPILPQLLLLCGMNSVVYFAPLDGWHLKEEQQSKMIWQGVDGSKIDALIRYPLDGSTKLAFFTLAQKLGDTINSDSAPSAIFAEFPSAQADLWNRPWLDEIRRMTDFASELGEFSSLEDYFSNTGQCGGVRQFKFSHYPGNALTQAVEAGTPHPISRWHSIYRQQIDRLIRSFWSTSTVLLNRTARDGTEMIDFAEAVTGLSVQSALTESCPGYLVLNPWNFPRRALVDVSQFEHLPQENDGIVLARESNGRKEVLVEVPPLGYAFVQAGKSDVDSNEPAPSERKAARGLFGIFKRTTTPSEPPMIESIEEDAGNRTVRKIYRLRNEYFEAKIDTLTGMLRSVFTPSSRFNRLSQQIALRFPKERRQEDVRAASDPNRGYTVMAADEFQVENGPLLSRLHVRGRLVFPDGNSAAAFTQTVSIQRRSRILSFELSLDPEHLPGDSPWDSYYALRSIWNDNTLELFGCLGDGMHSLEGAVQQRIQSPRVVDLRNEKGALTFLSEGLPFHRRFDEKRLDTILITQSEQERKFRYGIGFDLKYPIPASLEFLAQEELPALALNGQPAATSVWLFQIEAKNVLALHWEPIQDETNGNTPIGLRVFLLETQGRRAHFALSLFQTPQQAFSSNMLGEQLKTFKTKADQVLIDMRAHELLPLTVLLTEQK